MTFSRIYLAFPTCFLLWKLTVFAQTRRNQQTAVPPQCDRATVAAFGSSSLVGKNSHYSRTRQLFTVLLVWVFWDWVMIIVNIYLFISLYRAEFGRKPDKKENM